MVRPPDEPQPATTSDRQKASLLRIGNLQRLYAPTRRSITPEGRRDSSHLHLSPRPARGDQGAAAHPHAVGRPGDPARRCPGDRHLDARLSHHLPNASGDSSRRSNISPCRGGRGRPAFTPAYTMQPRMTKDLFSLTPTSEIFAPPTQSPP